MRGSRLRLHVLSIRGRPPALHSTSPISCCLTCIDIWRSPSGTWSSSLSHFLSEGKNASRKSQKKTTSQMAHPKDPPKNGHVTSLWQLVHKNIDHFPKFIGFIFECWEHKGGLELTSQGSWGDKKKEREKNPLPLVPFPQCLPLLISAFSLVFRTYFSSLLAFSSR